ncbi:MAG: RIP metalloprotease RseP [Luteolibacter sp.]|jgi:regulator of sigma E protease|nr:RIP metalloprotease RseP [Luteolibacter sp.]
MSILATTLQVIVLIAVVLTLFNIIIFVHELGHFWAAKWRGLQIDRFQIWFGKPLWKKEINGVQYGLGWIPAGGFVALPQMAPMEALEGGEKPEKQLPPISPLDKIIVAFAGPLFSMLLALAAAVVVWKVGKPADFIPSQEVGYLVPGSPAEKAGLQPGDKIIAINGVAVNGFAGSLDSISERIILSRGQQITYTVEREGQTQPLTLQSGFETEKTRWFQRRGLRQVGIEPAGLAIIGKVSPNSPAADAGLGKGDKVLTIDGHKLHSIARFSQYLRDQEWKSVRLGILTAGGESREIDITPERPLRPADADPMVGIAWDGVGEVDVRIIHPEPLRQVRDSLHMMWVTITSVIAPDSNIGVDHLSGPVGIAKMQYQLLQMEDGWRRILAFMVLFNVNLAVLNMLPFPVLDGGHITLAILEKIFGRPVKAKPLEILQTVCALLLISLMLFVTSKDIGDGFGRGSSKNREIVFPAD